MIGVVIADSLPLLDVYDADPVRGEHNAEPVRGEFNAEAVRGEHNAEPGRGELNPEPDPDRGVHNNVNAVLDRGVPAPDTVGSVGSGIVSLPVSIA